MNQTVFYDYYLFFLLSGLISQVDICNICPSVSQKTLLSSRWQEHSVFCCAAEIYEIFNSKIRYEKNSKGISKRRYRRRKVVFTFKMISPPTFSFHTIIDNNKCTPCSYRKTCNVLSVIRLCSYVAALLESFSHFTQHITSDGTKYLFNTIAGFGAYLFFSAYFVI